VLGGTGEQVGTGAGAMSSVVLAVAVAPAGVEIVTETVYLPGRE
jgi:hypothetical protein